jgi:hypothetical protein
VQIYRYRGKTLPNELVITQGAGKLTVSKPTTGGWTPITVRGHAGHAAHNAITWQENGLTDIIAIGVPDSPQLLTTEQLIAIADSAPA